MKTVAYRHVSTGSQNLDNQKLAIFAYARQKQLAVDRFVEVQASSGKGPGPRRTNELLDSLTAGDHFIVSELSRLGRPKGARGKSVLDGKEDEICILLEKQVSKASIAKILGVSRTAVHHFIRSRNLDSGADAPQSQEHRP